MEWKIQSQIAFIWLNTNPVDGGIYMFVREEEVEQQCSVGYMSSPGCLQYMFHKGLLAVIHFLHASIILFAASVEEQISRSVSQEDFL